MNPFLFTTYFLLVLFTLARSLQAQMLVPDDTLLFHFPAEVVITATRLPAQLRHSPSAAQVFSSAELDALPARTVGDVLQTAAGTGLLRYGGNGSLSLASIRGLGPEYTVVLLNGVRINDAQNGIVDFAKFGLEEIDRIEIVRGGFAALYGTDALGGIVSIHTGTAREPIGISIGAGSFGWKAATLSSSIHGTAGRLRLSGCYEESKNNFRFASLHDASPYTMLRENAGYIKRGGSLDGVLSVTSSTLSLHLDAGSYDVGVPGAVTQPVQGSAMQKDISTQCVLTWQMSLTPTWLLTVTPSFRSSQQRYIDPMLSINGKTLDSRYDNSAALCTATAERLLETGKRLLIGMEIGVATLDADVVRNTPQRISVAMFLSGEFVLHVAERETFLIPSLRFDHLSDSPDEKTMDVFSPGLGIHSFLFADVLALRAHGSYGFRAPTFNQRYWIQGGNPSLKPEFSTAIDAGLQFYPGGVVTLTELSAFHHDIRDRILWMPGAGLYWMPKNIQHVVSNGLEFTLCATFLNDALRVKLNAQKISSRKMNVAFPDDATAGKQLVYIPEYSASVVVDGACSQWLRVVLTARYIGKRYFTETNDAASTLPTLLLSDLATTIAVSLAGTRLSLKAEVLNLFNTRYEMIAFFPMPGRSFRFTLSSHLPSL